MNKFQEFTLGVDAAKYMRECLLDGHTLAKYLFERLDVDSGRVITFFPPGVDTEIVKQAFRHGGVLPEPPPETHVIYSNGRRMVPIPNTNDGLIERIRDYLCGGKGRFCIFEEAYARPSDPAMLTKHVPFLILNEEIYYFLSWKDIDYNKIKQAINAAGNFYPGLIGALTELPEKQELNFENKIISSEQLHILAKRAEKIIIGAYDGEGYLIWNKD